VVNALAGKFIEVTSNPAFESAAAHSVNLGGFSGVVMESESQTQPTPGGPERRAASLPPFNRPGGKTRMNLHLHRDMERLQSLLLSMSALVEDMIDKATRVLYERRFELADVVIQADETVDAREVVIEEECLKILALHQPVASDLRRVTSILKINNDLERIADLAVNIADRGKSLAQFPEFIAPDRTEQIVVMATQMVRSVLDAFVNLDVPSARRIIRLDSTVDEHNREIINELQSRMTEDTQSIVPALHCFSAVRHVERIADHAVSIAEDVIYLVEGEIIRHRHDITQN
jgi:phosphate transport system protein